MGPLEKQIERMHKEMEKALIGALGLKQLLTSMANQLKIENQEDAVITNVKTFMDNNASSMETAVKGKFGSKIKDSIENQKKLLDSLL
ncbi:hypothetical protein [Streptococcus parauberis]|uniref:hypothetical protein n=1 Tax=Streptococcus parauberis TaxID=1348 RepID=UPI0037929E7F